MCAMMPATFGILGFEMSQAGGILLVMTVQLWAFENLAQLKADVTAFSQGFPTIGYEVDEMRYKTNEVFHAAAVKLNKMDQAFWPCVGSSGCRLRSATVPARLRTRSTKNRHATRATATTLALCEGRGSLRLKV